MRSCALRWLAAPETPTATMTMSSSAIRPNAAANLTPTRKSLIRINMFLSSAALNLGGGERWIARVSARKSVPAGTLLGRHRDALVWCFVDTVDEVGHC